MTVTGCLMIEAWQTYKSNGAYRTIIAVTEDTAWVHYGHNWKPQAVKLKDAIEMSKSYWVLVT